MSYRQLTHSQRTFIKFNHLIQISIIIIMIIIIIFSPLPKWGFFLWAINMDYSINTLLLCVWLINVSQDIHLFYFYLTSLVSLDRTSCAWIVTLSHELQLSPNKYHKNIEQKIHKNLDKKLIIEPKFRKTGNKKVTIVPEGLHYSYH